MMTPEVKLMGEVVFQLTRIANSLDSLVQLQQEASHGKLDTGSDQASGGAAPGFGSAAGPENPALKAGDGYQGGGRAEGGAEGEVGAAAKEDEQVERDCQFCGFTLSGHAHVFAGVQYPGRSTIKACIAKYGWPQ